METYLKLTKEIMKFKSVSTDEKFKDEVRATSEFLVKMFKDRGFEVGSYDGFGNPIVFASLVVDEALPTVLVYGHYDVQPAEMSDGWKSDPFEFVERDGRFYGRGAIDNKGQFMVHVATVFDLMEAGKLKYNVKFLLEGDEETGSGDLVSFVKQNKDMLEADALMLSDGELYKNKPTIELSFRGVFNFKMIVTSSHSDLHSGLYGGYAPSSNNEVIRVLAGMKDDNGKILVDGFYEGLDTLSEEHIERAKQVDISEEEYRTASGCKGVVKLEGKTFLEQTGLYPSFEVTGFESGYTGVGFKNIIPHKTEVKFNVRTSPVQDPDKMYELLKDYFAEKLPDYVDFEFEYDHGARGVLIDYRDEGFKVAEFLEKAYGEEPVYKYCGGTVPIVTDLDRMFDMPIFLVPFANYDCGMHAANENFDKVVLEKALKFSNLFFGNE